MGVEYMTSELRDAVANGRCTACSAVLPLRERQNNEPSFQWECVACGARCSGSLLRHASHELRESIRMVGFTVDESTLPPPEPADDSAGGIVEERRGAPRRRFGVALPVIPLDDNAHPCGEAFYVVAKDVSVTGLGITSRNRIECAQLAMQLPLGRQQRVQVIGRVTRCRETGNGFDIGVEFVRRLSD